MLPATVKTLQYWFCCNLEMETDSCQQFLEFLKFYRCNSIKCLSLGLFPKLQRLHIDNCKNIEVLSIPRCNRNMISLKSLKIWDCDNLMSCLQGGLAAPYLSDLSLQYCKKLKYLPERMQSLLPSLRYLEINNCPEIECFPEGGLPSTLETLYICDCEKLVTSRRDWGLHRLPFLRVCEINGTCDEELLLEDLLLPCTLQVLSFRRHKNLKMLNYLGIRHLTALESLSLIDCPLIQSLPREGLPTSLSKLYIKKCPLLKPRLEWRKGEDWPKVEYIQCVIVDDEPIP
ncbi:hypothetical protein ACH5RR_000989 [Cinchona calisaya]|uniref:Disease resistance protein At4g27190-like leucine-rich repeats domain-containing protein n=1 Tax=Cinchona calisaya TaxID=153742 RepID=A0ABD3B299_9GENT